MKYLKFLAVVSFSLLLFACSNARYSTKKGSYLAGSKTLHPIMVPSDAVAPTQKAYYPVPNVNVNPSINKPSMLPPGLRDERG